MMITWFPIFKAILSALLIYLAFRPILKHMNAYQDEVKRCAEAGISLDPKLSFLPTNLRPYLLLVVVFLVILFTPFRLAHMESSERVVKGFDAPATEPPPYIERKAKVQYQAPSNQQIIRDITGKETHQ